jgi:hypothetical protein
MVKPTPVSAPFESDELEARPIQPGGIADPGLPGRLARTGDPFRTAVDLNQVLPRSATHGEPAVQRQPGQG